MVPRLSAPAPLTHLPVPPADPVPPRGDEPTLQECLHLADVPLSVEAVLDRVIMNVRAVADLQPGSLIVLSRSAGDNVHLHVGGVLIASGEVVVIENTIGVRITDLTPAV